MNALLRFLLVLLLIVLLGVGLRLMYYGFQSYTSSAGFTQVLAFVLGIVCFVGGLAASVFVLTPHYDNG